MNEFPDALSWAVGVFRFQRRVGLDAEHDMPTAVRNVTQSLRPDSADEITVVAKPGTVIKVVCGA